MDMLVSSALEADSSLPSFFEMFMTQQVEESIKPAARHAHSALATRWPQLHRISPWFDEAYLLVSLLIESRFLANHSSLLSESFYGLRRCRYSPKPGIPGPPGNGGGPEEDAHVAFERNGAGYGPGQGMRARDRRKALLTAAVLPYILAKLAAGHERSTAPQAHGQRWRQRPEEAARSSTRYSGGGGDGGVGDGGSTTRVGGGGLGSASRMARAAARRRLVVLRSLFFQVYPLLRASYEGSCLLYQWLYLFRRSAFFSPALRLTGMVVRRATVEDYEEDALAVAAAATRTAAASGAAAAAAAGEVEASGGGAAAGGGGVGDRVMRYARVFLVAAVVGFKVVEWWTRIEAQEGSSWRRSQLPPPPPPPQPPLAAAGGCGVPADSGACPACGGARVNATLCAPSGFVFCYRCLSGHVREHGECPVTGLACGEEGIVRLFDDEGVVGGGGGGGGA
eukprot:jgi/Undpi1/2488/HiC_scaffold_13.g05867.m1